MAKMCMYGVTLELHPIRLDLVLLCSRNYLFVLLDAAVVHYFLVELKGRSLLSFYLIVVFGYHNPKKSI